MQYNGKRKNLIFGPFLGQKRALAAPLELAQQHEQHENVVFLVSGHDGTKKLKDVDKKLISGQKTAFLGPKRATLGNRCRKTARRAAKRPPTGKPKVSRVTSGYGDVMIPLSRVRLRPKKAGYIGVA